MSHEVNLPCWVIRRYAVVSDKKVEPFETLSGATPHSRKNGGEIRELAFRLSKIKTITPRLDGYGLMGNSPVSALPFLPL